MFTTAIEPTYQTILSNDPLNNNMDIIITTNGEHPTLGLNLMNNKEIGNRLQLTECVKYTPAAQIPKWISTIRQSF